MTLRGAEPRQASFAEKSKAEGGERLRFIYPGFSTLLAQRHLS